jgi:type IV pilus assembly protein PilF
MYRGLFVFKFLTVAILVGMVLASAACVTTRTGRPLPVVDDEKAHDAHLKLGLTYLQRDNRESSRRHFSKALDLNPSSAPAHNGLAMLYQLTGEAELAEKSFLRSIDEDKDFTQARISYGRFLYEQTRYTEAYPVFERATLDLVSPQRALALTYMGQTALQLGDKTRAKSKFEHAVSIDHKLALAMIELGILYFEEKNYAESKKYLDRYTDVAGRTSKSLWLGIRIERIFGNKDNEASYALALKNLHPYSQEYLDYKKELRSSTNHQ